MVVLCSVYVQNGQPKQNFINFVLSYKKKLCRNEMLTFTIQIRVSFRHLFHFYLTVKFQNYVLRNSAISCISLVLPTNKMVSIYDNGGFLVMRFNCNCSVKSKMTEIYSHLDGEYKYYFSV